MDSDVLDLGEVEIPDWSADMSMKNYIAFRESENAHGPRVAFMLHDLAYVRSVARKRRYGEAFDPTKFYKADVKWVSGETAVWIFDHTIGWPTENGEVRDWRADWKRYHGGAA